MGQLTNFTYEELSIGQTASFSKQVEEKDIQMFSAVSGDVNPVHLDEEFAAGTMFGERIAHGMLTGAVISAALAMELPGPGTIYQAGQNR
jgi:3-hydroxybutyryl-CoA dehydratase